MIDTEQSQETGMAKTPKREAGQPPPRAKQFLSFNGTRKYFQRAIKLLWEPRGGSGQSLATDPPAKLHSYKFKFYFFE